ncbi:MAG TPA: hypothetical protein VEC01_09635 [Noviherbaspirillum sp.]|uniref:hypothetical protein n=1 Tax=Noviherbaspirillum sp. TaxID=1926288 RepID=UPI002D71F974|nr:hypothetical protein [Noviherbaspirillum sp.]HYD95572.1 hypothetical protein [Noviherbaspirillum sp.]
MYDKSISPNRQSATMSDKPRSGTDALTRIVRGSLANRQRAERERRDRYGRFGGR